MNADTRPFRETPADIIFRRLVTDQAYQLVVGAVALGETDADAAKLGVEYLRAKFFGIDESFAEKVRGTMTELAGDCRGKLGINSAKGGVA